MDCYEKETLCVRLPLNNAVKKGKFFMCATLY